MLHVVYFSGQFRDKFVPEWSIKMFQKKSYKDSRVEISNNFRQFEMKLQKLYIVYM